MKIDLVRILGVAIVAGSVVIVGCGKKPESAGVAEKTGAAMDQAASKTVDVATNVAGKTAHAAKAAAVATKDAAGRVVEKTGEVMESAGAAMEDAGADMQK